MNKIWWKEVIAYQIYVRSFKDSNGDGIGDIGGIIEKLDYIKDLGVDVIYLNPINQSPNFDNGYDISDFKKIMEEFGTFEDFENLIKEIHKRDMKLVMDLVLNHSSHEHKWFVESRKSKENKYRDYYLWEKPKDGNPPNNWGSFFGGSAWTLDEETNEYYLHIFSEHQPDFNWENEDLRNDIHEIIQFWIDNNIDGFRIDAINHLAKDTSYVDGEVKDGANYGDFIKYVQNLPKVHDYISELREKIFDKSEKELVLIGETGGISYNNVENYTAPSRKELDMTFHFDYHSVGIGKNSWEKAEIDLLKDIKEKMSGWQKITDEEGWCPLFYSNHDTTRTVSRLGDDERYHYESATMLALLQFTQKGTPFIYNGDEIGMTNAWNYQLEDYDDIAVKNNHQEKVIDRELSESLFIRGLHLTSRDNTRTPMQWNDSEYAGFSDVEPWIKLNSNYKSINVFDQIDNEKSILNFYKEAIKLRKIEETFIYGEFRDVDFKNTKVYSYTRSFDNKIFLIVANFFSEKAIINSPIASFTKTLILSNYSDEKAEYLRPYEARVYRLK